MTTLACKKLASMRANPQSMCKRMSGWSDMPTFTTEECEAGMAKDKSEKPERYACAKRCVPASDSKLTMNVCMRECMPAGSVAEKAAPKRRASSSIFLSGAGGKSGSCSASLSLDGFKDRRATGLCSYDAAAKTFGVTLKSTKGKSVKLDGESATFTGGEATLKHGVGQLVANAQTDSLTVTLPLEFTDEDGTWKGTLDVLHGLVTERLEEIAKGPVLFEGESSSGGGTASLLLIGGYTPKHAGKVVPLKQLDLIAVAKTKTRSFSRCNYTKGTKRKSIKRTAFDKQVTVYDRRTGKRLGGKLVKAATPSCPSSVKGSEYVISKHASLDSAFSFAKTFVR